jgi:NADH-quinone oxidoreductase subunit H
MLLIFFKILIFPGFMFLTIYGLIFEFLDRKVYARLQNRVGPPWYQPVADFLKLIGKETIIPAGANKGMFQTVPLISISAVATAFIYVPVFGRTSSYSFEGDLIIVLYLMTIPTIAAFLAGWYSRGVYATIGSIRTLTQFFAYEVPLFMALLAPALIAGTWSITGMMAFYSEHPLYILINIPVLFVALVSGQGKLERSPFDAPEAETEVVSGALVEYSGKLLAILKISIDCELVLIASILAAVFMPFMTGSIVFECRIVLCQNICSAYVPCCHARSHGASTYGSDDQVLLEVSDAACGSSDHIESCYKGCARYMIKRWPGKIANMAVRNLFKKPATIEYPKGKMDIVKNYRGKILYDPANCVNCGRCVRDCPAGAIKIINEGTKEDRKMKAMLNVGHCIFCCQCVDSCVKKCLSYSQEIDLASLKKDELKVQL